MPSPPRPRLAMRKMSPRAITFLVVGGASLVACVLCLLIASRWSCYPAWVVGASITAGVTVACAATMFTESLFFKRIGRLEKEFRELADTENAPEIPADSAQDELSRLESSARRLLDALHQRHQNSESQQQLFSSVLDSASEGVMAFQSLRTERGIVSDFVVVMANKSAEALFNRRSADMLGKSLLGLFSGNLARELFDRYAQVVETRIGDNFELFYNHDSIREWLWISMQPWKDGFVVTFEKISRRKRAEQELQASVEELERFNRAMIGREYRILEMKSEVNRLRERLGLPPGYMVDTANDDL